MDWKEDEPNIVGVTILRECTIREAKMFDDGTVEV